MAFLRLARKNEKKKKNKCVCEERSKGKEFQKNRKRKTTKKYEINTRVKKKHLHAYTALTLTCSSGLLDSPSAKAGSRSTAHAATRRTASPSYHNAGRRNHSSGLRYGHGRRRASRWSYKMKHKYIYNQLVFLHELARRTDIVIANVLLINMWLRYTYL